MTSDSGKDDRKARTWRPTGSVLRRHSIRRTRGDGYQTASGRMIVGATEDVLDSRFLERYRHKVQLIFTSPPFPLNRKKRYGNLQGQRYKEWLASFANVFRQLLKPDGSIVMELGNAWEPGRPVMSTLAIEALLEFLKEGRLHLCQQFICFNPARLPTPAQWVNVKRIRVKDAYTHVWWMSPTELPRADNRRVLKGYSRSMLRLLKSQTYNSGHRPSQHHIGAQSFLTNNHGAIPPNVLTFTNTGSRDAYQRFCREHNLTLHPARMPLGLADFFIRFLTVPRTLVMDPFAGSNTTGFAAELLKRRWISIESRSDYAASSLARFLQ